MDLLDNKYQVKFFRAIEDKESCKRFIEGHVNILTEYGITNISTNEESWMYDPNAYVIIAEDETSEVVGGIRIQMSNRDGKMPIQKAIGDMDNQIISEIDSSNKIVGEICGMWNARKVFGMGISAVIGKASVAYASIVGIDILYCLAAKYILNLAQDFGFALAERFGNSGTFVYPIESHLAHVLIIEDLRNIPYSKSPHTERILNIRNSKCFESLETGVKGDYLVVYKNLVHG